MMEANYYKGRETLVLLAGKWLFFTVFMNNFHT